MFIEMQVSYGKTTPVPEYKYFMMIVYLHVIEDIFWNSSTRALNYISMQTVAWFVLACQEHTTSESIVFIL